MSPKKDFIFHVGNIYILKIHHSERDLDYMIPKGIRQTPIPISKYNARKEKKCKESSL
jgi:hypothetical protein